MKKWTINIPWISLLAIVALVAIFAEGAIAATDNIYANGAIVLDASVRTNTQRIGLYNAQKEWGNIKGFRVYNGGGVTGTFTVASVDLDATNTIGSLVVSNGTARYYNAEASEYSTTSTANSLLTYGNTYTTTVTTNSLVLTRYAFALIATTNVLIGYDGAAAVTNAIISYAVMPTETLVTNSVISYAVVPTPIVRTNSLTTYNTAQSGTSLSAARELLVTVVTDATSAEEQTWEWAIFAE